MRGVGVLAERGATGYLNEWEIPFGIREEGIPSLNADGWSSPPRQVAKPPPSQPRSLPGFQPAASCTMRGTRRPSFFFFFFFFDDPRFPELAAARAGPDSMAKNATSSVPKPQHSGGHSRSSASHRPRLIRLPPASRGHYCSFWRNRSQPSTSELNAGTPLRSYGVDSLLAVEMASWILKETQVSLTVLEVFLATMPII